MRYLLIICLLLTGCSAKYIVEYDDMDRVSKITAWGAQTTTMEQGDIKTSINTIQESPLKEIINFQGLKTTG